MLRTPPLVALRAFAVVGRLRSVRRAAQELHVDHSVISRHLQNLEARIGVKLLRAEGRGLALTEAGERFHARIWQALEQIEDATTELTASAASTFSIVAPPGFAHRVLLPLMPDLQASMSKWEIVLHPSETFEPAGMRALYIVFANTGMHREGMLFESIMRPRLFPVANPRVNAHWLQARSPRELLELPLIHSETGGLWIDWFAAIGIADLPQLRGPKLRNTHLALEAAKYGQGIALANEILVQRDLEAGDLVEIGQTNVRLDEYVMGAAVDDWETPPFALVRRQLLAVCRSAPHRSRPASARSF